eukprot:2376338-Pleurochrysis_carterae.AAC.4
MRAAGGWGRRFGAGGSAAWGGRLERQKGHVVAAINVRQVQDPVAMAGHGARSHGNGRGGRSRSSRVGGRVERKLVGSDGAV